MILRGRKQSARERGYAVLLGRPCARSAHVADYVRALPRYRAVGVVLTHPHAADFPLALASSAHHDERARPARPDAPSACTGPAMRVRST